MMALETNSVKNISISPGMMHKNPAKATPKDISTHVTIILRNMVMPGRRFYATHASFWTWSVLILFMV